MACCCSCELLGFIGPCFHSLPDGTDLGSDFVALAGNPAIAGGFLTMSTNGSAVAWLGGFPVATSGIKYLGAVSVGFDTNLNGSIYRLYLAANHPSSVPSTNYIEITYNATGPSAVTLVGDETITTSALMAANGGFSACVGQEPDGTWYMSLQSDAFVPGAVSVPITPTGASLVFELVSSTGTVVLSGFQLSYPGDTTNEDGLGDGVAPDLGCDGCAPGCVCPYYYVDLLISGVSNGPNCNTTVCSPTPVGNNCSDVNGTYTIQIDYPACDWSALGTLPAAVCCAAAGTTLQGVLTVTWDPIANTTTATFVLFAQFWDSLAGGGPFNVTYEKVSTGQLTCAQLAGLVLTTTATVPGGAVPYCTPVGSTVKISRIY